MYNNDYECENRSQVTDYEGVDMENAYETCKVKEEDRDYIDWCRAKRDFYNYYMHQVYEGNGDL